MLANLRDGLAVSIVSFPPTAASDSQAACLGERDDGASCRRDGTPQRLHMQVAMPLRKPYGGFRWRGPKARNTNHDANIVPSP